VIPKSEAHLRVILKEWRAHYNGSRPHMALGPGVPDLPAKAAAFPTQQSRHRIREGFVVLAKSVLGGLHHEYSVHLRAQDGYLRSTALVQRAGSGVRRTPLDGMFAPVGTPRGIISRVNTEVSKIITEPRFKDRVVSRYSTEVERA
jgi:Integrase core domain